MNSGVLALGAVVLMAAGAVVAELRPEVVERIKPVGQVTVEGAAAPEAAAAKPAETTAQAEPATTDEPAAQEEPAADEPAAQEEPATADADAGDADAAGRSGKAVYDSKCFACHATGAANAPKLGDAAAWQPRIDKGMDALMQSTFNGVPGTAMTPRGTCSDCTDAELRSTVEYMVNQVE